MKKIEKIGSFLLMIVLICSMSVVVFAAGELPDVDRVGSITVTVQDTSTKRPVSGGSLEIYQIAVAKEEDGNYLFEYSEAFADSGIPLKDIQSENLAKALFQYAVQNQLSAASVAVDANGTAKFTNLKPGLYLITQNVPAKGYTALKAFLVSIPLKEDGRLVYDVSALPKAGTVTKNNDQPTVPTTERDSTSTTTSLSSTSSTRTTTSTPKTLASKLPQTGQLWWPVAVLAIAGVGSLVAGRRKKIK